MVKIHFFITCLLFFIFSLNASESLTSDQYSITKIKIEEIKKQFPNEPILVVSDFDNTLFKPLHLLGSDQFYEWQAELIKENKSDKDFSDMAEFTSFHNKMMNLTSMSLTNPEIPTLLEYFKNQNIKFLVLTSRGPDLRALTENEIKKAKLNLAEIQMSSKPIMTDLLNEREISYNRGILLTSGLNKGLALHYMLKQSDIDFKHIIFIDDMERHTINVTNYFANDPELAKKYNVISIRYSKEDEAKKQFLKNTKAIKNQIKEFKKILNKYFPASL